MVWFKIAVAVSIISIIFFIIKRDTKSLENWDKKTRKEERENGIMSTRGEIYSFLAVGIFIFLTAGRYLERWTQYTLGWCTMIIISIYMLILMKFIFERAKKKRERIFLAIVFAIYIIVWSI